MSNPIAKITTGVSLILGGSGLLAVLFRRTARSLAKTIPPGVRYGWRTILNEQFKTYAEGVDSWLTLCLIVAGVYLVIQGYRAWLVRRHFRSPYHFPPT